ncbi:MAG: hypothetical protein ACOYBC_00755 [Bilifractor sp.]|jgi:hypothetical protein
MGGNRIRGMISALVLFFMTAFRPTAVFAAEGEKVILSGESNEIIGMMVLAAFCVVTVVFLVRKFGRNPEE